MRYRVESYDVVVNGSAVVLTIPVPDAPWQKITAWEEDDLNEETDRYVTESIRLIIDETANVVLCSSMKKANVDAAVVSTEAEQSVAVAISIPSGATIEDTDYFTIEFDWGDAPGASPSADALAQFFGVTLLEGYEFMTDTEVCDELEDIMQVIDPNLTAEQAAAITAQTLNPSES